jgi:A/G-specific adenine glycosylase
MPGRPAPAHGLRRRLLAWYRRHARALPWRESPSPYRVLVSEIMLQQTRVAAVIPYYERFLLRFPTVRDLAGAPVEEVLALWSGLGYYGRARRLHQAAQLIVARYGGEFPRGPQAVRELPGVGRYTAGALLSIAFQEPEPAVDGNVSRVLARVRGIRGDPRSTRVSRRLWRAAEELLDPRHPGDFNQALMELGATVCTPAQPDCDTCPLPPDCLAQAAGRQESLPTRTRRTPATAVELAAVVLRRGGRFLLVQRQQSGQLSGLWEFPGVQQDGVTAARLARALQRQHRLVVEVGEPLGEVRHGILDRRIRLAVYRGRLLEAPSRTAGRGGWRWVEGPAARDGGLALAASARKVLALLDADGDSAL